MHITRSIRTLLFAAAVLTMSVAASAQIRITVGFGPPAIPVYEQPECPGDGYLWNPGYWAWDGDDADYYWVPGTWVEAPEVGFLWTPPWWGWDGGVFLFHEGFWGPHVGFYGGINYGFGYFGDGFVGGRWDGGHFFYNRDVFNVNVTNIHNVYNEHVTIVNNTHVSYNGGQGGITARASALEEAAMRDRHVGPVAAQNQQMQAARSNRDLRALVNQGRPSVAATARPGDFHGAVAAREAGAPYHAPENRGAAAQPRNENGGARAENNAGARSYTHPSELPAPERLAAPNTGNAKQDQKYQKQQQKLMDQQNKERQKLQAQQDKEHAQLAKQNASEQQKQQVEQRHAQQTQQLQQRHSSQVQNLQSRQAPRGGGERR